MRGGDLRDEAIGGAVARRPRENEGHLGAQAEDVTRRRAVLPRFGSLPAISGYAGPCKTL